MDLVVAGSRTGITKAQVFLELNRFIKEYGEPNKIISGAAKGVDSFAAQYAKIENIPLEEIPFGIAPGLGKRSGKARNVQMAIKGTALLALWDGKSKGTSHMIDMASIYDLKPKKVVIINVGN